MDNERQETVADIVREMRNLWHLDEKSTDKIPRSLQALGLRTYADRILAAHNREMNALARRKEEEASKVFIKNAELVNAIAVKCAVIASLRLLVKELTDALDGLRDAPCDSCMLNRCLGIEKCKETKGNIELVAKAREVVK